MRNGILLGIIIVGAASSASAEAQKQDTPTQAAPVAATAAAPAKPALPLEAYVGTFGPATVVIENGELIVNAPEGPRKLTPLGQNAFTIEGEPGITAEFQTDGTIVKAIEVIRSDVNRFTEQRTK